MRVTGEIIRSVQHPGLVLTSASARRRETRLLVAVFGALAAITVERRLLGVYKNWADGQFVFALTRRSWCAWVCVAGPGCVPVLRSEVMGIDHKHMPTRKEREDTR